MPTVINISSLFNTAYNDFVGNTLLNNQLECGSVYVLFFITVAVSLSHFKENIDSYAEWNFIILLWILLIFNIILFFIFNEFTLFIGLECLAFVSYIMLGSSIKDASVLAAVKYFVFSSVGTLLIFGGLAAACLFELSTVNSTYALNTFMLSSVGISDLAIFFSFMVKIGGFPFYF